MNVLGAKSLRSLDYRFRIIAKFSAHVFDRVRGSAYNWRVAPMRILQRLAVVLAFVSAIPLNAQLAPPKAGPIVGARQPALSPDGKRLAFVYRGDIWLTSHEGGRATPLTQHVESDAYPLFSPDGQWLAFASRREGSWDIYVMPSEGGQAKRITWHGGADMPTGWSPDGKQLLFTGKRDTANFGIYSVDVATGELTRYTEDFAKLESASFSPDGKRILYGRYGFPWTRPRYVGSAAEQVWVLNVGSESKYQVTTNQFQQLWPQFLPDGKRIVAVSIGEQTPATTNLNATVAKIKDNPDRTPNLWFIEPDGKRTRWSNFSGGAVRWPSVASKSADVAFEYDNNLWLLKNKSAQPQKLALYVSVDTKQTTRRGETLSKDVTEAEPSPDGKLFAFGLRGDIWTIPMEKSKGPDARNSEFARRLTDWAGDDSDFTWSADGKKLYFTSDREFNVRLYEMELETLKVTPLWKRNEDITRTHLSPDGKQMAFWVAGADGGLYVLDLKTKEAKKVVSLPAPQWNGIGGGDYSWSPDSQWLCYSAEAGNRSWNLFIVPAKGGEAVNVTKLNAYHSDPAWSPDGKYIFFRSTRDGNGLYALPLQKEEARLDDAELKFEKPPGDVKVKIDFADISRRIRRVATQYPDGEVTFTSKGLILFLSERDIWSLTYDGKTTKRLTTGGNKSALRLSKDGNTAYFVNSGELFKTKLPDATTQDKVSFLAEWERDVADERKAAFTQFWRSYNRGFYDPNFHGRDWTAIRQRYEPLLTAIDTNDEFASLLNQMIGELEASHSEVSPTTNSVRNASTPHLGFEFDYSYKGPGLKVARVPEGAPGSFAKTRILPGEYVMLINGQDVKLDEKLYDLINDKGDRLFEFAVNTEPKRVGSRIVKYRPLKQGDWDHLLYQNRIERLEKETAEKSGGKIGYLHISAMGRDDQNRFEREAYEYIAGKEALIIDVRFNRGGNISDTLIDWLERKQHAWFRPRDGAPEPAPNRAWDKPVIVLMNEHSYSNGEMFPNAMRTRELGHLVGMPTPGYVIWTMGMRLVDGTNARMPQSGVYRQDGTPMENKGEQPDIRVPMTADDWLKGRDPQLDKAIEMLRKR
jgi:tricorn protease